MRMNSQVTPDWRLALGDLRQELTYICPAEMQTCSCSHNGEEHTAVWRGHPRGGEDFTVTVRWREVPDGLCSGTLEYTGYTGSDLIESIQFPVLAEPQSAVSKIIVASRDMGYLRTIKSLFAESSLQEILYGGGMQFSGMMLQDGTFLYVDHRDTQRLVKMAQWALEDSKLIYRGVHLLPVVNNQPSREYQLPYQSSWGKFRGGWFDACQIYKQWGSKQAWAAKSEQVNPLRKIGLWVWNRGLIKDVMPPVEKLQQDLGDVPVALDWYWWHSNPYDTDYPEFWPPREGEEAFRAAIQRLTRQNIFVQTYINGVCWDLDGKSWSEGGAEEIRVLRDGTPMSVAFNRYNGHRLGYMCGEAPKFQDKISALVGKLRRSGLSGQYLDMIGCATFQPCYHPEHKHPKGGGNVIYQGFRKLIKRLKQENPNFPLTTETSSEGYMDLIEGFIICGSTSGEHMGHLEGFEYLPMFSSVYHGKIALFGNYAHPDGITPWDPLWPPEDRWQEEKPWHKLFPDQFFFELSRTLIWGAQPMVCNITLELCNNPEFAEIYQFILDTARFYHQNLKYLFDGEMLSPDGFQCRTWPVKFLARMIFTKQGTERTGTLPMPAVLHSCWRAPDGSKALFLANYTGEPQTWQWKHLHGTLDAHCYERIILE